MVNCTLLMTITPVKKSKSSLVALLICYALMCYTAFSFYPKWNKIGTEATISWDASGYYMYLPALFIYQDIKQCGFKDSILDKYGPTPDFQQAFIHEKSGNYSMKYAAGQALVLSPFFAIGHLWATQSTVYPADGFSYPYQITLGVGMFLIALIGLFFLRRLLLVYFKDNTVALVLLLYVFGTNYLNYAAIDQVMTHNSLFSIYAILVWCTIQFYKKRSTRLVVLISFLAGLATLIRPTEFISILIPILWGVSNWQTCKERIALLKKESHKVFLAVIIFSLVIFIQPLYWKYATGEWIVYSYQDQGFSWLHPHIWDYTMSYNCGWLRYCPMMILPLVGSIYYTRKGMNSWSVLLYSLAALYITMAWDVWDYGGTAGRAMIQHYVILAFPFAHLIEIILKKRWTKIVFIPLIILFTYLNIWWVYQAHAGEIQVSGNTRAYYKAVVGRWSVPADTKKLLDNKFWYRSTPKHPKTLLTNSLSFKDSSGIILNKEVQWSQKYSFIKPSIQSDWIRATATFHCKLKEWNVWNQCQFILRFYDEGKETQTNLIRVHRFLNNGDTKRISLDAKVPTSWNKSEVQFWNANGIQEVRINDLSVITFNE